MNPLSLNTSSLSLTLSVCHFDLFLSSFNCLSSWLSPFLSKMVYNFQAFSSSRTDVTSFAPLLLRLRHTVSTTAATATVFFYNHTFVLSQNLTSPFQLCVSKKNLERRTKQKPLKFERLKRWKDMDLTSFKTDRFGSSHTHTRHGKVASHVKRKGTQNVK